MLWEIKTGNSTKHSQNKTKMKKIFYIFALAAFTLTSCNDNEVVQKQTIQEPTPPTFVSKLPSFNSDALYVVGREYETIAT